MKVTVCFGEARFVVPCPPGTTVLKLEQEAVLRYKRKNPDSWVVVHHLQSQAGILDPEDHIGDVADDREEIIASFEDAGVGPDPGVQQGGGDGASGSSVGTGSPDIFQKVVVGGGGGGPGGVSSSAGEPPPDDVGVGAVGGDGGGVEANGTGGGAAAGAAPAGGGGGGSSCIEVSANEPGPLGLGLQVRRGSEPSLHQIGVTDQRSPLYNVNPNGHHQETSKRWSAAPVCRSDSDPPQQSEQQPNGGGVVGSSSSYHHHHHLHLLSPEWNVPEEDPQQQQQQQQQLQQQQPQLNGQPQQQQQQQQLDSLLPQAFNRSGRLSMQFLGADATTGYRWMDAAEKAAASASASASVSAAHLNLSSPGAYQPYMQYMQQQQQQQQHQQNQQLNHSFHHSGARGIEGRGGVVGISNSGGSFSSKSLPRESTRKEPLGQAKASVYDSLREKDSEMLLVVNETGGPLGLTAIPDKDRGGLLVQSVEPGSRAERGRLRRGDRILEINNIKLVGLSESSVQEHLKKSLASTELRLRVVRGTARKATAGPDQKEQPQQQQPFAGGAPGRLVTGGSGSRYHRRDNRVGQMMIEAEEERPATAATKVATVSPTRKMPGGPSTAASSLQVANTRKLGKRIEITLTKGDHGLGFSVTTRDNPAGGHCPIYIKNILPKGAAVEDGRLKPGDRLLEVEGIPMTGKSQTEVVSILRGTPHGATLKIVVSRQQELADVTKEREIGFGVESEPKSITATTVPKPPPPAIMPKSSLKQSNSSNSLAGGGHHQPDGGGGGGAAAAAADEGGVRGGVTGSRSMQKLSSASSPKTPTVQKKPLASILKSASTNQVADLLLLHDAHVNGVDSGGGGGGAGGGGSGAASLTFTNGGGGGGGASLSGAAWKNREILTLHIPVHDTEKAGLGVSVKGKTGSGNSSSSQGSGSNTSRTDGDLGIFVKSVLHGGAASRDGRLKMNDQLLSVNGVSLLGQSNAEAMETLRRAMLQQSGGSYPGKIILTVARRIGRPVSTGELLETIDPRPTGSSSAIVANGGDQPPQQSGNAGTTVIYLSPDKQQQHRAQDNVSEPKLQQSKRYSNPVLDRLTGGSGAGGAGGGNTAGNHGVVGTSLPMMMMAGNSDALSSGHYAHVGGSNSGSTNSIVNTHLHHQQQQQQQNQRASALRPSAGGSRGGPASSSSSVQQTPPAHGLRNESYYMATGEHWNTTSSATSLNGSNAVLIEEDPEPTSPTFHLARPTDVGGGAVLHGNGNTSTPNGADTTYASQLSLETNPPPSDAFSRDAIGRRSMSEKHHAAMDARETGTYQRNKKLREERERDSKLLLLAGGAAHSSANGSAGVSGGSMESISHQMARIDSLRHGGRGGGGGVGRQQPTAALAAHLLRDEAQDQLGDLGPSLGMKKSSSLESLQTMVQEIQMADEPRGPNALRTPRGRGRDEILRALVEQPPEATQAKKHWLLEEGPTSSSIGGGTGVTELPDGGFVSRNSPFQSSLNDGKGAKLRVKKSGGLLRGIGHMFRFGKHRKDGIAPTMVNTINAESAGGGGGADYSTIGGPPSGSQAAAAAASAWMNESSSNGAGGQKYGSGGNASATKGGTNGTALAPNNSAAAAASRYILFDPNSVERSASSGVVYGHHQPPHYQPPPPPPGAGASGAATSIHHTDVFNHRYSHYVNYEELQQQISRQTGLASANSTLFGTLCSRDEGKQQTDGYYDHHVYDDEEDEDDDDAENEGDGSYRQCGQSQNGGTSSAGVSTVSYRTARDSASNGSAELDDECLLRLHQLQQLQQWQWVQRLQQELEHEQLMMHHRQRQLRERRQNGSTSLPGPSGGDAARMMVDADGGDLLTASVDHNGNTSAQSLQHHPYHRNPGKGKDAEDVVNNNNHNHHNVLPRVVGYNWVSLPRPRSATSSFSPLPPEQVTTLQQRSSVCDITSSRRHHHYHSQRSARNTPPVGDIGVLTAGPQSQQHQPQSHHHHTVSLHNQGHSQQQQQQQKYKSVRPTSCYYDSAGGGYETISSIGPPLNGGGGGGGSSSSTHRKPSGSLATNNNISSSSSSGNNNTHTLLTVSSTSSSSSSKVVNGILPEEANGGGSGGGAATDWHLHHHPGSSGAGGGGGTVTTGSMRNTRGPFVTQVKIQNQMSYQ